MRQFSLVEQYIKEPCSFRSHIWANKWSSKKQTNKHQQTNKQTKTKREKNIPWDPKKAPLHELFLHSELGSPSSSSLSTGFCRCNTSFHTTLTQRGASLWWLSEDVPLSRPFFCWNVTFNFAWPLVSSLYLQHLDFLLRPFCQEAVLLLPWFTSRSWQAFILCQALTVNLSFISPRRSQPKPYS